MHSTRGYTAHGATGSAPYLGPATTKRAAVGTTHGAPSRDWPSTAHRAPLGPHQRATSVRSQRGTDHSKQGGHRASAPKGTSAKTADCDGQGQFLRAQVRA
eukprot:4180410-Pyramimonas_sp.AAC.1